MTERTTAQLPAPLKLSVTEMESQYVKLAEQHGLLAELCRLSDYDPSKGKVPEHWKPLFLPFFEAAVKFGVDSATPSANIPPAEA